MNNLQQLLGVLISGFALMRIFILVYENGLDSGYSHGQLIGNLLLLAIGVFIFRKARKAQK